MYIMLLHKTVVQLRELPKLSLNETKLHCIQIATDCEDIHGMSRSNCC